MTVKILLLSFFTCFSVFADVFFRQIDDAPAYQFANDVGFSDEFDKFKIFTVPDDGFLSLEIDDMGFIYLREIFSEIDVYGLDSIDFGL